MTSGLGGIEPFRADQSRCKAPGWGARLPELSPTVGCRSAPEQTMNTTWSELLLMGVLLAVLVLSGRI